MESNGGCSSNTSQKLLRDACEKLRLAGVDTESLDSQILLSRAAGMSRTQLIAHPEYQPSNDTIAIFQSWVERRVKREPLAYIIGEKEFYGLTFEVNPAVLIPRPDTEILVEESVKIVKGIPNPLIADIGVGSGAIAVSLAYSLPSSTVYGTEVSNDAIEVAGRNAERLGVGERVHILEGDLLQPLDGMSFDLIVSNPPYIPSADIDSLEHEVSVYEPKGALDGGPDGLEYYRRLCLESLNYLSPRGCLAVEVGQGQADSVKALMMNSGFIEVRSVKDYSGIDRVVIGCKRGE